MSEKWPERKETKGGFFQGEPDRFLQMYLQADPLPFFGSMPAPAKTEEEYYLCMRAADKATLGSSHPGCTCDLCEELRREGK